MALMEASSIKTNYNYIVIGGGSGGLTVAIGLKTLGKDVLLISKDIGGECTHSGCMPSKSLLFHAQQFDQKSTKDKSEIFEKVRKKISEIEDEDIKFIKDIDYVIGTAEFTGNKSVLILSSVGTKEVKFKKCIVSTGSSPIKIEIPGLPKEKLLTNENIFNLNKIPASINIIG